MIRKILIALTAVATFASMTMTSAEAIGLGSAARGSGTTKQLRLPNAGNVAPLAYQIFACGIVTNASPEP